MTFNPFEGAFGLDISDHAIKLVRVHSKARPFKTAFELQAYGRIQLPDGAIRDGEITRPEEVVAALRKLIKKAASRTTNRWAVVGIPEYKTFLKHLLFDSKEKITTETVQAQLKEHIPLSLDDLYISWQKMPSKNKQDQGVLAVAAPKKIVDSYTYLLEIVGISPLAFEPESVALSRCIGNSYIPDMGGVQAVVHITREYTSCIIFDSETIRLSHTFLFKPNEKQWIHLATQIKNILAYFAAHIDDQQIEWVTLCGELDDATGLDTYLSAKLKMIVQVSNPLHLLHTKPPLAPTQNEISTYTTAIGLALRAADNPLIKRDDI